MKTIIALIIALITGISFYASSQTQKQDKELDNKTFRIKLKQTDGKNSGWQWTEDEISFKAGTLKSKFMSKHEQFPSADCSITVDASSAEKIIGFSAAHKNTGVSDIKWEGTVTGNKIKGTAVWTNMQGTRSYTFSGTIKGK